VERALHGVQRTVRAGEALDGRDALPVGLHGQHGAALHAVADLVRGAHEHRARAAVAGVTADDGAGFADVVAEVLNEEGPRLDRVDVLADVDIDRDAGVGHWGVRRHWRLLWRTELFNLRDGECVPRDR